MEMSALEESHRIMLEDHQNAQKQLKEVMYSTEVTDRNILLSGEIKKLQVTITELNATLASKDLIIINLRET